MAATLFAEQKGMALEMKAAQFELIVTHAHERERERNILRKTWEDGVGLGIYRREVGTNVHT